MTMDIGKEMRKFNGGKNGNEGFYLSPNHPKVNSYLLTVFRDLIENYELDGLHLDYVRFHDSEYGQNPGAIAYFQRYNGMKAYPPEETSGVLEWNDHRRKAITDLVRETKNLIETVRPGVELSAAVKPNLYQARERYWIATYNQPASQVVDKVKYTRVTRFKGISFFSYNVMAQNPQYFRSIKKILYPRG